MSFYRQKWDEPWLTPSIATVLMTKSPYHARRKCPFFPEYEPGPPTVPKAQGTVVDALVLGGQPNVSVIEFSDFKTGPARAQRDACIEAKRDYLSRPQYDEAVQAARTFRDRIIDLDPIVREALTKGAVKTRLMWGTAPACSTEPDLVLAPAVLDLKRTAVIPTEEGWRRQCRRMRYDLQVGATIDATGCDRFYWLIVEAGDPHAAVIHRASDIYLRVALDNWRQAKALWLDCLQRDHWPSYQSGLIEPDPQDIDDDIEGEEEEAA